MDMMHPSMMVSRLDLVVLELAAAGIDFRRLPYGFCNIRVFIEKRGSPGAPEVGTTHLGTPGPPGMPWWVVLPLEQRPGASSTHWMSSGPKNPQKVSLRLDSVWY